MENITAEYSKISPTAKITAYWRSLSDIPYSREIAETVHAEDTARQMLGDRLNVMMYFSAPMLEARYKAISYGLKRTGTDNVMELACGLCPRGLEIASRGNMYVGTDLPVMIAESAPLLNRIAAEMGIDSRNLHYQAVNVMELDQLQAAAERFRGKPFGICNEGLLMYLSREEKAIMAAHVHKLLSASGGVWVTTDILFNGYREKMVEMLGYKLDENIKANLNIIGNQVGRDLSNNNFEDEADALKFYNDLGFEVEFMPQYDGSYPLSTLANADEQLKEIMLKMLSAGKLWVLRPRRAL